MNKEVSFEVRCSVNLKARAAAAAAEDGLSLSAYVRFLLMQDLREREPRPGRTVRDMMGDRLER